MDTLLQTLISYREVANDKELLCGRTSTREGPIGEQGWVHQKPRARQSGRGKVRKVAGHRTFSPRAAGAWEGFQQLGDEVRGEF